MELEKGFTLVELLVVIVIIGLLVVIAVPSAMTINKKIKQRMLDTKIELIESSAIVWGQSNKSQIELSSTTCNVDGEEYPCIKKKLSELIDEKMLEEDEIEGGEKVLVNPITDQPLNDCVVEIYLMNKRVYSKYDIDEFNCYNEYLSEDNVAFLLARNSRTSTDNFYAYKSGIEEVKFVKHVNHGSKTIDCNDNSDKKWCVANTTNGTSSDAIIAWLEPLEGKNSKYILYIGSEKEIFAPINSKYLFADFAWTKNYSFDNFNTLFTNDMSYMFYHNEDLETININSFNTKNVIDMSYMFYCCYSLSEIQLKNLNTSNVKNMSYMFYWCALNELNLENFKTNKVENMSYMFAQNFSLKIINVKNFDTRNVKDMSYMFSGCSSLNELNLSSFKTEKVETMESMFYGCKNLTILDLNSFYTSQVKNMSGMFWNCSGLIDLKIDNFNTEKVETMKYMFDGCKALTQLNLSNFDTWNVKDVTDMFSICDNLITLDISNFILTNANLNDIFRYSDNLEIVYLNDETSRNLLKEHISVGIDLIPKN